MGKKSTPAAPAAPDPTVVANAQSASNIATAQAQQKLNMINTNGPQGSVTYQADPNAPGGYSQTTTLNPGEQSLYNSDLQAQNSAAGVANQQIGRVATALDAGLNPSGVQTSYSQGGPIQTSFDQGGQLQYGFNPGQQVQGQVGPQNLAGAYQAAANASYDQATSRLDPQYALQQKQLQTQLANQGLSQNDDAYASAMQQFNNAKTDAYNQADYSAQNQGLNAENTLFGQSVQQGQFANQAAAQQYTQNQGQAAFNNTTAGQAYTQNLGSAQFANAAQAQQNQENANAASFGNQANSQQFQQNAYAQNLPINEFNSLMSGTQVGMPTGVQYTPSQVNPTDVLGAYALNSQVNQANYQSQMANQSSTLGGLFNLGSSALGAAGKAGSIATLFSDVRLKRDVELIGREDDGLGVYRYRYLWDDEPEVGVLAQEAMVLRPHAVVQTPSGFLAVDYGQL